MNTPAASFYNKFSFFYPLVDVFLKPQKKVLFREINLLPEGDLLEIGVGNGSHLNLYKKHRITGIDTSDAMLQAARKKSSRYIKLIRMSGESLQFDPGEFDYVVLSHLIAVVDSPELLLNEVHRVLKPQGQVFILNHFTPDNWLKFIDYAFGAIAKRLHFRSVFHIGDITAIEKFDLLKELNFRPASYFKLLIYRKK